MQNDHNSEFSKQTTILKITGHVTLNFPRTQANAVILRPIIEEFGSELARTFMQ